MASAGSALSCAHAAWTGCLADLGDESACVDQFAEAGVDEACVEAAFQAGCRRDHGWYPEVEAEAYPWLLDCLAAP